MMLSGRRTSGRISMSSRYLVAALCVAAVMALALPAFGQENTETKTITVKGIAAGAEPRHRDDAIMDAQRKAIEQGVGTFIQSQTEVEDYAVIYDKIISNTKGYISEYKIVDEGIENRDDPRRARTWVKIQAVVKLGNLKDDWQALAFLIKKKGNPKIMVVIRDKINGKADKNRGVDRATVEFESFLQSKNIRPVDKATMEENKLNDIKAASLEGNLSKVAALGKEYRANLVVIGYADSSLRERTEPYKGAGYWYFYRGSMVVKVVRTDDAQIIFSMNIPAERKTDGTDKSQGEAANKALVNIGKVAAPKILAGIMKAWNEDITLGSEVTVTIQGVNFALVRKIMKKLKGIRFVTDVSRDHFSNNIVKFRVKTRYDSFKLADKLIDEEICQDYQVTDVKKNAIDVDLTLTEDE